MVKSVTLHLTENVEKAPQVSAEIMSKAITQQSKKTTTVATQESEKAKAVATQESKKMTTIATQQFDKTITVATQESEKTTTAATQQSNKTITVATQESEKTTTVATQESEKTTTATQQSDKTTTIATQESDKTTTTATQQSDKTTTVATQESKKTTTTATQESKKATKVATQEKNLVKTDSIASSTTTNAPAETSSSKSNYSANITVYIEMIEELDKFYGNSYTRLEEVGVRGCSLPNNSSCMFQHTKKDVDVVYRQVQMFSGSQLPYRYCDRQIVAMLNSEAEQPALIELLQNADIRIDHHLSSAITVTEACGIPWKKELYKTPDPSGRKGVALLMSNCGAKWRNDYILELSKYIHIYSYGGCFHNTSEPPSRDNRVAKFPDIAKRHRMVVTFENTIQNDYITEKIVQCYNSGVIPVYWGPPEIYQWVPGNHSFIDPQKFKGPKELAEYLKRVDEDDDLFRYHTTNFAYTQAEKTHTENCFPRSFFCGICEIALSMKLERGKKGMWPRTCLP